jgi:predicted CoA-binding protein
LETEEYILNNYNRIAVVGASRNPESISYHVVDYLTRHGYHVIPINPNTQKILGLTTYPNISAVPPGEIEVVNVFLNPAKLLPLVEEAIIVGIRAIWFQEGVINHEAARRAKAAGFHVVMDKCIQKEHSRMLMEGKLSNVKKNQ